MRGVVAALAAGVAVVLALAVSAPAGAQGVYPPATDPGKGPRDLPRGGTLRVCKSGCEYRRIQDAIDAAGRGTTIRVGRGRYREGLRILSRRKDRIRLIGDPRNPSRVVLEGRGLRGARAQNGVLVNNAFGVTVNGFHARNFKGSGFFVVNVDGYRLTNLVAERTGAHGLFAFNSKGGELSRSVAFYNAQAGLRVGQTPPQTRPKRTTLRGVVAWGNAAGYLGTNSRYVTIAGSRLFNNGAGIVADVSESERYAPHEQTTIVGSDVFWNNFNFYAAAPFAARPSTYPVGAGIVLLGGRTATVEANRVFGNHLVGLLAIGSPAGHSVRRNDFGLGGGDLNGRDVLYDGSGDSNCFEANALRSPTVPADGSTLAACGQPNAYRPDARDEALSWAGDATREAFWVRNPHQMVPGIEPLERWTRAYPEPELRRR